MGLTETVVPVTRVDGYLQGSDGTKYPPWRGAVDLFYNPSDENVVYRLCDSTLIPLSPDELRMHDWDAGKCFIINDSNRRG